MTKIMQDRIIAQLLCAFQGIKWGWAAGEIGFWED